MKTDETILNLRCQSCGGILHKTGDNEYECPFCHSKQVILESDEVKIEKEWAKHGYKPLSEEDKKIYLKLLAGLGLIAFVCLLVTILIVLRL
ncbi:MAG: hypothetical protein J6U54_17615 [Clostridiales bacterium]|nr:hypothetical protein [Clostridiales bacterium]